MSQCSRCKKDIKFFGKTFSCDECDFTVCENCESQLKECEICGGLYCPIHINSTKHECDECDEQESDDISESSSEIIDKIQKMDEKQLLRLLVYMKYDNDIENIFNDFDEMIDKAMERK